MDSLLRSVIYKFTRAPLKQNELDEEEKHELQDAQIVQDAQFVQYAQIVADDQSSQVLLDDDEDEIVPPSPRTTLLARLHSQQYSLHRPSTAQENQLQTFVRYDVPEGKADALNAHRMDVLILREDCRQQREMIALHRQEVENLSQSVLSHFYQGKSDPSKFNYDTAQALLDKSVEQRESLRQKEQEYQDMEKNLNRKEWELKQEEAAIFNLGVTLKIPQLPRDDVLPMSSDSEVMSEVSDLALNGDERSPLTKSLSEQLAARRSDAEQVVEEIEEINAEKQHRIEQKNWFENMKRSSEHDFDQDLADLERTSGERHEELQQLQKDIFALEDRIATHLDLSQESRFSNDGSLHNLMTTPDNTSIESMNDEVMDQNCPPRDLPLPEELLEVHNNLLEKDLDQPLGIGFSLSNWFRFIFVVSRMDLLLYRNCANVHVVEYFSSDSQLFQISLLYWTTDTVRRPLRRPSSTNRRRFSWTKGRIVSTSFGSSKRNSQISQYTVQDVVKMDLVEVQEESSSSASHILN